MLTYGMFSLHHRTLCVLLLQMSRVMWSVFPCLCVWHSRELKKNSRTIMSQFGV